MIGKLDPELLEAFVFDRTGAADERVRQGSAYGEDTAAIDLGDETLVVNSDPISLAVERIGTLGVTIASNDVAASGARPAWLTSVIFLPDDEDATLDAITRQLDDEAERLGISIVGGHTEYNPSLETPLLSLTCLGVTDRYVPTGGAEAGDRILITKGAAIEGSAILATDFRGSLDLPSSVFDRAETFFGELSVIEEATILSKRASAMHDPTEGGVVAGLFELAVASGVRLTVDPDAIPVREETDRLCAAAGVDPLRVFGSGALLATVSEDGIDDAVAALEAAGIETAVIGTVESADEPSLQLGDVSVTEPVIDEMYALWG